MPDWSYHSLFKPILFRMAPERARDLTIASMRFMGTIPGGQFLLDIMADEMPHPALAVDAMGIKFSSRVALGAGLNVKGNSLHAFERFGFGFLELGPVTVSENCSGVVTRDWQAQTLTYSDAAINPGLDAFLASLPRRPPRLPVFVRVAHLARTPSQTAENEIETIVNRLPKWIAAIVVDSRWSLPEWETSALNTYMERVRNLAGEHSLKVLLSLPPDSPEDVCRRLVTTATDNSFDGITVAGGTNNGDQRICGVATRDAGLLCVKRIRDSAPNVVLVASGGIIEPADAEMYFDAGANFVQVHSGFVFSGPGLPKRINELMTRPPFIQQSSITSPSAQTSQYSISAVLRSGWLGFAFIGAGLIVTCSSAITVGLTSVILPYDEQYLGMTREAMMTMNKNLLPFMSHDRVTYAGSAISCGMLFMALAYFGARQGQQWAYRASLAGNTFGFLSFLLFLGFHYLDPLHALSTFILLPFLIWAMAVPPRFRPIRASNRYNSEAWRTGLIGQQLFVGIGLGLVLAGITICKVGTSTVFVPEDLMFMHTTAHDLLSHNEHLLPAIAHDRAGFGGSLVTCGLAVLLTALQGFRQGEGWVWWMLLLSGLPGFVSTLAIHFFIGYTNSWHLLPAYIASVMFVGGLCLCYRYLCIEQGPPASTS